MRLTYHPEVSVTRPVARRSVKNLYVLSVIASMAVF